jgi:hypothetical protein
MQISLENKKNFSPARVAGSSGRAGWHQQPARAGGGGGRLLMTGKRAEPTGGGGQPGDRRRRPGNGRNRSGDGRSRPAAAIRGSVDRSQPGDGWRRPSGVGNSGMFQSVGHAGRMLVQNRYLRRYKTDTFIG